MKTDKEKLLKVSIISENQRMHYAGSVDGQETVSIDYTPPLGDNLGYTSLELLLLSLASCVASTVSAILRGNGSVISSVSCTAEGTRRQEHPKGFSSIDLNFVFEANRLQNKDVATAIRYARESVAPVWCLLRDAVPINVNYRIVG